DSATSSASYVSLPRDVPAQPRLSPRPRRPAARVDGSRRPLRDGLQCQANSREIVEDGSMLHDDVRLARLVIRGTKIGVDRSRIDALVDLEQCHANVGDIAACQCPEAAVGIPVFRADPRVHDEGADARQAEYSFGQYRLAACEDDVWLLRANECL